MQVLILADGGFPANRNILKLLNDTEKIVCCDGAVKKILEFGREPYAIVGDMDNISPELCERFSDRIFLSADQETNDLTKAVEWCIDNGIEDICILGATGLREDHTLGNISLLADYAEKVKNISMLTDYGRIDSFRAEPENEVTSIFNNSTGDLSVRSEGNIKICNFLSFPGQQVSIFALTPETYILTKGLKYPINNRKLTSWWQGTLNESTGEQFELRMEKGSLLIYRVY